MLHRFIKLARIVAKDKKNYVVVWDVVHRQEIIMADREFMLVQMTKLDNDQELHVLNRWSKEVQK